MSQLDAKLAFQIEPLIKELGGRLPTAQQVREVSREHGVDVATMFFFRSIVQNPLHTAFHRLLNQYVVPEVDRKQWQVSILTTSVRSRAKVLQAQAAWVQNLARQSGFKTDVVELSTSGTLSENVRYLDGYFSEYQDGPHIVVTLGLAALELHLMLAKRPFDDPAVKIIRGWLNLGSEFSGSAYVSRLRRQWGPGRWWRRLELWRDGVSGAYEREWSEDFRHWQSNQELHVPHLFALSFVPFCLRQQMAPPLWLAHDARTPEGPNNSEFELSSMVIRPGYIYPIWGASGDPRLWGIDTQLTQALALAQAVAEERWMFESELLPVQDVSKDQWGHNSGVALDHKTRSLTAEFTPSDLFVGDGP